MLRSDYQHTVQAFRAAQARITAHNQQVNASIAHAAFLASLNEIGAPRTGLSARLFR